MYKLLEMGLPFTFSMENPSILLLTDNSQFGGHCITNHFQCISPFIHLLPVPKEERRSSSPMVTKNDGKKQ
ncbi:hypothetical protein E1A91_D08G057600v1 [Gossypium mustelinum]|uniref:Uncharacterized protein n=1 Tax=Gossypium mustelinum TaxID=34275 RepID=A0A5D2TTQ5_GOSMU|nr:hypothetical protein E1A91_D08G057600v1 [Gossypium mustelinum]